MLKLKKALEILLIAVLCMTMTFGFAACGDKGEGQETPEATDTEEPAGTKDEGTLEISVNPGLTDISEVDWGVCLSGDSVQYDLGLDVSRDWAMKATLDRLDLTDLESQKSVLRDRVESSLASSQLGKFQLTTSYEQMGVSLEEAKEKGLRVGDMLSTSGFEEGDPELMILEAGAYFDPMEEDYFQFSRLDSRNYAAAEEADVPELCDMISEAYGIKLDEERMEKALKEVFNRAAYYIVPESGEYNEDAEEESTEDTGNYGEGGTYTCSVEQTANVTSATYFEKVTVRITAQQIQIGEAAMYVHIERNRHYND